MNLQPERQPEETFEDYKVRRKEGNDFIKALRKGSTRSSTLKNLHTSKKARWKASHPKDSGQHPKLSKVRTRIQHKHVLRDENNNAFTLTGKQNPETGFRRMWVAGESALIKAT
jgi:hypothetical protein